MEERKAGAKALRLKDKQHVFEAAWNPVWLSVDWARRRVVRAESQVKGGKLGRPETALEVTRRTSVFPLEAMGEHSAE